MNPFQSLILIDMLIMFKLPNIIVSTNEFRLDP